MKKIPSFHHLQGHISLFLSVIQLSIISFVFIPPINAGTKLIPISEPNDWTGLIDSLSKAKMAGINIYVSLLPPSKTPPICQTCNYSEPYRLDFISWAKEIANLSLRYSNLTGYTIEDLQENLNLGYIRQTYLDSMEAESKSINPKLQFITLHNIYYVDRDASGNGSGSSWTNASKTVSGLHWATINGGDTVYISGGTDSTVYSTGHSGIAGINYIMNKTAIGNPIVITKGKDAGHNGDVYFTQNESPMRGYAFSLDNCHNIKLTGLIFTSELTEAGTSHCLYLSDTCSNCIIDNCQITSNGSANGITFSYADSITINNCTITVTSNNLSNDQDNVHIGAGIGGYIFTNNKFYNYGYNSTPHNDLIQIGISGSASLLQTVIANNLFYYVAPPGTGGAGCIYVSGSYGERYLIYNNVFVFDNTSTYAGITMYRYDDTKHLSARIFNNTFVGGMPAVNSMDLYTMDTVIVKNNIVVNDSGARNYIKFRGMSTYTYKDIDYNHYWSHNLSGDPYVTDSLNHGVDWGTWQGKGYDTHSDTGTVSFANIWGTDASDYMLSSGSAGIDAGTDLSAYFTTDILGTARPRGAGWDKGALESK